MSVNVFPEKFVLTENTLIFSDQNLIYLREYLKNLIYTATGFKLDHFDFNSAPLSDKSINLILRDNPIYIGSEGYNLKITQSNIELSARTPVGIFYGIQTMRQLFPIEIESKKKLKI